MQLQGCGIHPFSLEEAQEEHPSSKMVKPPTSTSEAQQLARRQSYLLFLETMERLYQRFKRGNPRDLRDSIQQGPDFLEELIMEVGGDVRIVEQMGLSKGLFDKLVDDLISHASLVDGQLVCAVESTAIFCCMMRQGLTNRQTQERFQHSG